MKQVRRLGRILDLVGLVLVLAGGGMVARAWSGFEEVRTFQAAPDAQPFAALRLHDRWARVQRAGTTFMVAGVAVFVTAWWVARRDAGGGES